MRLSTKVRYAVRAVVDLAINYHDKPVMIKDIAKRQKISERYLENIFTKLRSAGILESIRGKKGGFKLAKEPNQITVLSIFKAVVGKVMIIKCISDPEICEFADNCLTKILWEKLNTCVENFLESITISDVIQWDKKNPEEIKR